MTQPYEADVRAAAERVQAVITNFQGRSMPLNGEQQDVLLLCRYVLAATPASGPVEATR